MTKHYAIKSNCHHSQLLSAGIGCLAVDSIGNALGQILSCYRNQVFAKRFFKKIIANSDCKKLRVINVDKAKAFLPVFAECQTEAIIPMGTKLRQQKYLNNMQEQDHRFVKRLQYSLWFQAFNTAYKTVAGCQNVHTFRKWQIKNLVKGSVIAEVQCINNLFGVIAQLHAITVKIS